MKSLLETTIERFIEKSSLMSSLPRVSEILKPFHGSKKTKLVLIDHGMGVSGVRCIQEPGPSGADGCSQNVLETVRGPIRMLWKHLRR